MPQTALRLFVNYRRADNAQYVETLRTHFMYRYGRENVFMDFDSIPPFTHFADFIREQVRAVDALVMIIGPRWVELLQDKAAKHEPDYVLVELEEAVQHNKVVAPILIQDTPFPPKHVIPAFLQPVFDAVNIPSLRPGLDTLNNIDRLTAALEAEVKKQGKQRTIQQQTTTPPTVSFDIHAAFGHYFEAEARGDYPAALVWIEKIRHSGKTIPPFFTIDAYETTLRQRIKAEEEERRRREVADYLYGFIRQMVKYKRPATEINKAFAEVWAVYPDYDPDGLKPKAPPTKPAPTLADANAAVQNIIGAPFEWCEVPAGPFLMGSDRKKDEAARDREPDLHEVTLPTFWIAKYPITYSQFQTFVEANDGIKDDRWWQGLAAGTEERKLAQPSWEIAKHPRETVSWYEAMAFCRWLSHRLGGEYAIDKVAEWAVRLPIEAEWEKAARGTDGRIYPWGDTFDKAKCNTNASGIGKTTPVDQYPQGASPYGVLDMSGNVWEWCLSEWTDPYEHHLSQEINISNTSSRVLRGGSWPSYDNRARAARRGFNLPGLRNHDLGGRVVCVRPPSP
ncbi:MAG: SUMF1/EgtB/PvdO family nonheme iron enzyme [Anaerolineales bacterium]|nr:SUMF1/EgtB/PvdO family nonheme iron enzyme [Anaerolineales bacterium]